METENVGDDAQSNQDNQDIAQFQSASKKIFNALSILRAYSSENSAFNIERRERFEILMWYNVADKITEIYNFEQTIAMAEWHQLVTTFEQRLSSMITSLSALIVRHYKKAVTKPYICNFLCKLTYRCRSVPCSTWLTQELLLLFLDEIEQPNSDCKHEILLMFANVAVLTHCYRDPNTKRLLLENDFIQIMYRDFEAMNKECNGCFRGNEVSFTLYILAWSSSDASNEYLQQLIADEKLNALQIALDELQCALNGDVIEYEAISFVPAVWNRVCLINILVDSARYRELLISKDIFAFLCKALKFEEKQRRDTTVMCVQCCQALAKLSQCQTHEIHTEFLKCQFDDHDLWNALSKLYECMPSCRPHIDRIHYNMTDYYFKIGKHVQTLSGDCFSEIVAFIW